MAKKLKKTQSKDIDQNFKASSVVDNAKSTPLGHQGLIIQKIPGYFLLACIFVSGFFLLNIFTPFVTVIIFAAILATVFHPLYDWILKLCHERQKIASLITCFLVLLLIVIPLMLFIIIVGKQALDTYRFIQSDIQSGLLDPYLKWEKGGYFYDILGDISLQLDNYVDVESINIKENLIDIAKNATGFLAEQSANILKGIGRLLLGFFVLFFSLYYFFKDGHAIIQKIMVLSPLPNEHETELFQKFKEISYATLYGIFLTSIVQGIIAGIGFAIAGVPNALLWGTATSIFSLVPIVGTASIWFPMSMILLLSGNIFAGIFVFLWGLMLVSTVDNFLRAYLIGGKANMNQLLIFLAVFGGILWLGLPGVIFGPLILTLFFAFLHIYEKEYEKLLHSKKEVKSP